MNADRDKQTGTTNSSSTQRLGQYELREPVRYGSLTDAWKGFDTHEQRPVVLKLFQGDQQRDPDFTTRFLNEMEVAASLHHPHIVRIYDYQLMRQTGPQPEQGKRPLAYIAMEYVEGMPHNETLADCIAQTAQQGKFLAPEALLQLFATISQVVDYAHQQGIVHRSIQPANILLAQDNHSTITSAPTLGKPMLMGFGLFKLLHPTINSALYIAPEQAQGYPGNERSDIYALGAILYELCTGVPPFRGDSPAAIARQHLEGMPASPVLINPQISPTLTMVLLHALAKDPSARFSSASSLTAALAEALSMPLPDDMNAPFYRTDAMSEPTYIKPSQPSLTPTSSTPMAGFQVQPGISQPGIEASRPAGVTPFLGINSLTPQTAPAVSGWQNTPAPVSPSVSNAPAMAATPLTPMPSPFTPVGTPRRQRRRWLVPAIIILLVLLIASGLGTFFWFTQGRIAPTAGNIVGEVFFYDSGQLSEDGSKGINDQLQLNLHHIPAPQVGKSYYAWLRGDNNRPDAIPLLLGPLTVTQAGQAHFFYKGLDQHTNLLAFSSRILITEEDAHSTPVSPSTDHSSWRYSATLPQQPDPNDALHHYSILDHLRYLLAEDPTLGNVGIHGGLNIWLQRNTAKILEWSGSARDYWNSKSLTLMRTHFVRILEYLDGDANVQADLPLNTQLVVTAPVALIGTDTANVQDPLSADYLHRISGHLNAIAQAPGVTPDQQQRVRRIINVMNRVRGWLAQVRTNAQQLIALSDAQLLSQASLTLLNDMVTQAFYAYVGQIDPTNNQVQEGGVVGISYDIERLATLDITAQ